MRRCLRVVAVVAVCAPLTLPLSGQYAAIQPSDTPAGSLPLLNAKPAMQSGSGLPLGPCTAGKDTYVDTSAAALYICATTNTWTLVVPGTRTITAGAGLTGGGDLVANRTLALSLPVASSSQLAANGSNCAPGNAAQGVDAAGNAEGCFVPAAGKFFAAGVCIAQNTLAGCGLNFNASSGISFGVRPGTIVDRGYARFAGGSPATSKAYITVTLPPTLPAALTLRLVYSAESGSSQAFSGTARTLCLAETGDQVPATFTNGPQALLGMTSSPTPGNSSVATVTGLSLNGCNAGDLLVVELAMTHALNIGFDLQRFAVVEQ